MTLFVALAAHDVELDAVRPSDDVTPAQIVLVLPQLIYGLTVGRRGLERA